MTWHNWSREAFARAKSEGKPLLAVRGPRPHESLRAAEAEIKSRFVPVLADPHSRPDAAARIGHGRAVVLAPDGARRGSVELSASNLAGALSRLADEAGSPTDTAKIDGPVWTGAVREKGVPLLPDAAARAAVFGALEGRPFHEENFEALLFVAGEHGDARARAAFEDGFERIFAESWDGARKTFTDAADAPLAPTARRARLMWDAHALTGDARWRQRALDATEYLLSVLREPTLDAFRQKPGLDVFPADGNALAALALLRASAFGVAGAQESAIKALGFLQARLYDPLLGLVHAQGGEDESVHGLLGDAAWTALAFTEAFLATGVKQHREFADGLLRFLFQELWERDGGGFLDRVPRAEDPAILRETHVDPHLNAVALEVCWRLHHLKGNANYRRWFDWGLRGAWAAAGTSPERLASLARAGELAERGRADFELVGRPGEVKAAALLAAFRRGYVPRGIVSFVDPDDQDYIMAHKLEAATYPRLFGCGSDLRRLADTDNPDRVAEVAAAVRAAEKS
jgi:hypothetical protein